VTLTTSLLFETPLIVHELAKSAELAAELVRLAATRRASDNSGQPWETDSRMLRWAGDPAIQLLEGCVEIADRYTVDIDVPEGRTRYGWWADLDPVSGCRGAARGSMLSIGLLVGSALSAR